MRKIVFIIEYNCFDSNNQLIKNGKMKVKNRQHKFEAQCDFENFLKKKYLNFGRLVVISCVEENPFTNMFGSNSDFNNIFDSFGDIFGGGKK